MWLQPRPARAPVLADRPSVAGSAMPSLRILRKSVVLWMPSCFAVARRLLSFCASAARMNCRSNSSRLPGPLQQRQGRRVQRAGRCSFLIMLPGQRTTPCSMMFSSSRTLPG